MTELSLVGNAIGAIGATQLALLLGQDPNSPNPTQRALKFIDLDQNKLDAPAIMHLSELQSYGYVRPVSQQQQQQLLMGRTSGRLSVGARPSVAPMSPTAASAPVTAPPAPAAAAAPKLVLAQPPSAPATKPTLRLGVAQANDFASQRSLMQLSTEAAALPLGWLEGALLSLILMFGWVYAFCLLFEFACCSLL